jgi:hypothetical protein
VELAWRALVDDKPVTKQNKRCVLDCNTLRRRPELPQVRFAYEDNIPETFRVDLINMHVINDRLTLTKQSSSARLSRQ